MRRRGALSRRRGSVLNRVSQSIRLTLGMVWLRHSRGCMPGLVQPLGNRLRLSGHVGRACASALGTPSGDSRERRTLMRSTGLLSLMVAASLQEPWSERGVSGSDVCPLRTQDFVCIACRTLRRYWELASFPSIQPSCYPANAAPGSFPFFAVNQRVLISFLCWEVLVSFDTWQLRRLTLC